MRDTLEARFTKAAAKAEAERDTQLTRRRISAREAKPEPEPAGRRRASSNSMWHMSMAFDDIIAGEETAKMLAQYPEDVDFASFEQLPHLPDEPVSDVVSLFFPFADGRCSRRCRARPSTKTT